MRQHIISGFLCCALLTFLAVLPSSAKLTHSRAVVVQAKTKLPRLDPSDPYLVYYGTWDDPLIDIEKVRTHFKLVIAAREITKEQVAKLKANDGKPKPLVFGYISIGEDGIKAKQNGPAYPGEGASKGQGPCYREGTEFICEHNKDVASYYLDEYKQKDNCDPDKEKCSEPGHDQKPDRNIGDPTSGSLYVNTEDPEWRKIVKSEAHRLINDLGCDGLFLDTLDMGWNGEYEWTRPAMRSLIFELNQITPNIIVNRGLFFVHEGDYTPPEIEAYKNNIWGVMFENYYTSKGGTKGIRHSKKDQAENDRYIKRLQGVQVFGLDFVNSSQKDFAALSKEQCKRVRNLGWLNYISWELTKTVRYDFQCPKK